MLGAAALNGGFLARVAYFPGRRPEPSLERASEGAFRLITHIGRHLAKRGAGGNEALACDTKPQIGKESERRIADGLAKETNQRSA